MNMKRNIATFVVMVSASIMAMVSIGCDNEVFEQTETASVTVSLSSSMVRMLYTTTDVKQLRIQALLLESDQTTIRGKEHDATYGVDEFPKPIPKLSIGYTRFIAVGYDDNANIIAQGAVVKQLKKGENTLTLALAWVGTDTPQTPALPDDDEEVSEYDTSSSITLSLKLQNEAYAFYISRSDYQDPLERTVRVNEPLTLGQSIYLGKNGDEQAISYRWLRSRNRETFEEIAHGTGTTGSYIEPLSLETTLSGLYYLYLETHSDNGTRTQYQNSELFKVKILPPPPEYYRSPTGIGLTTRSTSLTGEDDAVLASVGATLALRKNKLAVVSFKVQYEDSGYLGDPRTVLPTIEASENVSIISTEVDSKDVPVYYSCLIETTDYGLGWLECLAGAYSLRVNVVSVSEVIKDGKLVGAGGRLTDYVTPIYEVRSANASRVHVVYFFGGQSQTNYAYSYLRAFINDEEEPVDTFSFPATSSYGSYTIHKPHAFTYESSFQNTSLYFRGRSGDYTSYIGWVFAYFEE
jgi:hypothetical protein